MQKELHKFNDLDFRISIAFDKNYHSSSCDFYAVQTRKSSI